MSEKPVEAGGWEERHPSALLKLDQEDGVERISLKEGEGIESFICNEGR